MKLISKKWLKSTDTLTQDHRLHTKNFSIFGMKASHCQTLTNSFPSILSKIHKGVIFQAFLWALPTNDPWHTRRVSFIEQERIQDTPEREKRRFQSTRVFAQWRRRWSTVSSSKRQKKYLFAKKCPLLWSWSRVKTFPQEASQAKKATLGGVLDFQILPLGNKGESSGSKIE